jgi:hypothetical protein
VTGSLFVHKAAYASPINMGIDRTRVEFSARPGDTIHGIIVLSNDTAAPVPIHVQSADFEPQGEDGKVAMGTQNPAHSLKDWITPTQTDLVAPGRAKIPIDFDVHVPPGAKSGAYWGIIILKNPSHFDLAPIVLVNVLGEAQEKLTVASFEETTSATGALTFTARFKNDGDLYEKPKSTITIKNFLGQTVAETKLPPENILPGAIRRFITIIPINLGPGPYKATLKTTYGEKPQEQGQEVEASTQLWIKPKPTPATATVASIPLILLTALAWALARQKKSVTP